MFTHVNKPIMAPVFTWETESQWDTCHREKDACVSLTTQPGRSVLISRLDWLRGSGGAVGSWERVESLVFVLRKCLDLMGGSEQRSLLEEVVWETNLKSCC